MVMFGGLAAQFLSGGVSSLMGGAKPKAKAGGIFRGGRVGRRRRRARLSARDIQELTMLKQVLGKTAAANALPFYMGRR